jgi:lysophospholipase L1-like esterase
LPFGVHRISSRHAKLSGTRRALVYAGFHETFCDLRAHGRSAFETVAGIVFMRFLGLGDSLTQGVGDPRPGRAGFAGELDGWVSHFADAVRLAGQPIDVRNLATAGARLGEVIAVQLPTARSEKADITSCFVGVNDLWDANLDFDEFGARFHMLFRELSAVSPIVITASIHDVFAPFPIRQPLREKLNRHVALMNDIIASAVDDYGLVLIDLAGRPEMFTSTVRSVDLLHPNRYGHQLLAVEVVNELHRHGHLLDVLAPVAKPIRRGTKDLAHIAWVTGYVRNNWGRWQAEIAASKAKANEGTK